MSRQTGVSRRAIIRGIKELDEAPSVQGGRVRRPGGRKRTVDKDASLKTDLEQVDPVRGRSRVSGWTCKSATKDIIGSSCRGLRLQANRKTLEGSSHADRDQQFQHINQHVTEFLQQQQPVISVGEERVGGPFKNHGAELRPKGAPEPV